MRVLRIHWKKLSRVISVFHHFINQTRGHLIAFRTDQALAIYFSPSIPLAKAGEVWWKPTCHGTHRGFDPLLMLTQFVNLNIRSLLRIVNHWITFHQWCYYEEFQKFNCRYAEALVCLSLNRDTWDLTIYYRPYLVMLRSQAPFSIF